MNTVSANVGVLRVWQVLNRLRQKKRSVVVISKFLSALGESSRIKVNLAV